MDLLPGLVQGLDGGFPVSSIHRHVAAGLPGLPEDGNLPQLLLGHEAISNRKVGCQGEDVEPGLMVGHDDLRLVGPKVLRGLPASPEPPPPRGWFCAHRRAGPVTGTMEVPPPEVASDHHVSGMIEGGQDSHQGYPDGSDHPPSSPEKWLNPPLTSGRSLSRSLLQKHPFPFRGPSHPRQRNPKAILERLNPFIKGPRGDREAELEVLPAFEGQVEGVRIRDPASPSRAGWSGMEAFREGPAPRRTPRPGDQHLPPARRRGR